MVAGMVRSRWMRWGTVCALALAALTGCSDGGETQPSTGTPAIEPTVSSEDLLEQAREVYDDFREAVDDLYASTDPDFTTLSPWATDEVATLEAASAQDLIDAGIQSTGSSTLTNFELQGEPSEESFEVAVCEDVSATTFTSSNGEDVTPTDRDVLVDLTVTFDRRDDRDLLISAVGPWDASGVAPCG